LSVSLMLGMEVIYVWGYFSAWSGNLWRDAES